MFTQLPLLDCCLLLVFTCLIEKCAAGFFLPSAESPFLIRLIPQTDSPSFLCISRSLPCHYPTNSSLVLPLFPLHSAKGLDMSNDNSFFPQIKPISNNMQMQTSVSRALHHRALCCVVQFFFFTLFPSAHLNHAAVRRNMCVIVSPSVCFIVHTTTSEGLPLISGVSESPLHHHLLPAASLNAFLLRAVLCPSDSSSFSTSSFIIPMGINGFYSLAAPKALSFSAK